MTICIECQHYQGPTIDPKWYQQYCKASPRPKAIDPCTGKEGYRGINDLGTTYYDEQPYQYCRDLNDGNCQQWEGT